MKGLIERYTGEQVEITKKSKPAPSQKTEESSTRVQEKKVTTTERVPDTGGAREKTESQGWDKGWGSDTSGRDNRGGVRGRDRPSDRDQDRGRQNDRKGRFCLK